MSKIVPVPTVTMSNYNNSRTPTKNAVPAIATVNDLLTTCDSNIEQQQALLPLHLLNEQILVQNKRNAAKLRWWHAPPPKPLTITEPQISATMPILQQELAAEQGCKTTACQQQQQQQQLEKQQTKLPHNTLQQANTASPQYKNNNEAKRITYAEQQHHHQQQQHQQQQKSFDDFNDIPEDCCSSQSSELLAKDPKPCVGLLNPEEEDQMQVTGYRRSAGRMFLCWICICLTGGILRLVMHWWRHWYLMATHVPCPLDEAEKVLIQDDYQGKHKTFYVKTVQLLSVCDIREQLKGKQKSKTKHEDLNAIIMPMQNDDWNEKNMHLSVHFTSAHFKQIESVRVFNCKQLRYAWDQQSQSFIKINGLDVDVLSTYLHSQRGLSAHEQLARRLVYGSNEISIPYRDVKTLLFLEVLNPFYVFQIFSVILWFTYDYYYYACVILLMSIFGISMSIVQTKKNQDALRETVQNTGCALVITEKGEVKEVPTQSLVPGDIIEIPSSGCIMQCDAVLLTGNCILDEAMLTGESVPVTKTPLPVKHDMIFDKKEHARHTLFCGTKVIQTRYIGSEKVLAIVINTGNITAKGGLIRSILYPPPVDYKFEQDSYKFIAVLGLIALIGFTYTLVSKILRHVNAVKIIVESLDLITIVVPPALPAAMTVGRFYAQKRLERNNIYCISPRSINVAGSIDCCCFDKTGTLTEDGLDMWGVVPKSAINEFQIPIKQIERLSCDNFLFGMVTCHSITVMNGKMMGDPLDLKMFESTGWILEDPKEIPDNQKYGLIHPTIVRQPKQDKLPNISGSLASVDDESSDTVAVQRQSSVNDLLADVGLLHGEANNDHGIVREFPFTSAMQRMSVITRRLSDNHFCVYCKGSPEMLQQLCKPSSTPPNYSQQLATFAKQGYRVIAMAYKPLSQKMNYTKAQRLTRESVESELEFLGFVVLENRLKPDTTEVIQSLTAANIRTIMVTGDNVLTALSVARDCGIVQESQAVVTVNVRSTPNKHKLHELYYTLEMGNKDCAFEPAAVNGNGSLAKGEVAIDVVGVYGALNGDVSLSNSASMLQNSSSLTSVETCDTWTHADVETGVAMALPSMKTNLDKASAGEMGWQHNYRFAMVGETWQIVREYFPDELRNFVTRGSIFARMSPEQKQSLIMELQSMDYCVAMCGDGANDCGALKVAHTGISLSETESSIASPFTSRNPTIACVPKVIKEGRAALVTSFGIFKYMAAYSMVQFISVMILYSIDSNLTDKQYLYIDLGLISVFAFFFGKTESYDGVLVKQVPLSSLISLTPLASIILHLMIVIVFQVSGWFHVHAQDWFTPFVLSDDDHFGCFENYTMFAISGFQYIILAFVFSKGVPYRKPIWSNIPFCLALLINLIILIYMVVIPPVWLTDFFQLIVPPVMEFRYWMLGYGIFSFVVHVFVEAVIVEYLLFKKIQVRRMLLGNKRQHMQVEYDLKMCSNWPPITHAAAYEASELEATPIYVEMRAGQKVQMPVPQNTSLFGFFEVETPTTPSAEESLSPKHDFPPASGTQALFRQTGATNINLE